MKNLCFQIPIFFICFPIVFSCHSNNESSKSGQIPISDSSSNNYTVKAKEIAETSDNSESINKNFTEEITEYYPNLDFPLVDESRFINSDFYHINISPKRNYNDLKNQISIQRKQFQNQYINAKNQKDRLKVIDSARNYITEMLINYIIPHWYGMRWTLSGYSEIPNEGEVGCSYFVSNTMKHCSFKLNRYKLAQQNTKNIALSIQLNDTILILNGNNDISTVKKYFLNNKREGLYYVGLDCHVGYLLFRKRELFFIHSSYSYPLIVLAEFSEQSNVFSSNKYYIADITWNDKLILKWLQNEEIFVIKD